MSGSKIGRERISGVGHKSKINTDQGPCESTIGNQPHESTSAGRLRAPRSLRHAPVDPFQQISELCRRDRHGSIP